MADQGKLSEERLELIRRFMGEPPREPVSNGAVEPAPAAREEPSPVPAANGKPRGDAAPLLAAGPQGRANAFPVPAQARVLWYRVDLRWPIAVVILGLLVGLVLAR